MPAPSQTIYVSSAGTGQVVPLDWMAAGPVTVRLTAMSTTGTAGGRLEMTLNDLMITSTGTVVMSSIGASSNATQLWLGVSSQGQASFLSTSFLSSGFLITMANIVDTPMIYTFTVPIGGLRFNCSGFSSGGIRMDVLQGKGF